MSRKRKEKKKLEDIFPTGVYELCLLCILLVAAFWGSMLSGCSVEETNRTKVADLEYSIIEDTDIPEELMTMIEEKKAADFKLTYEMENDLYIVRGYGEQATGGYSIRIKACYLTSNAILFDTELIGPRKGENASASPSYPYIVIKTEKQDLSTIFE